MLCIVLYHEIISLFSPKYYITRTWKKSTVLPFSSFGVSWNLRLIYTCRRKITCWKFLTDMKSHPRPNVLIHSRVSTWPGDFRSPGNVLRFFSVLYLLEYRILCGFILEMPWNFIKITAKKTKFCVKDFFSKCDQICSFLRTWSHSLKKYSMERLIFCAVDIVFLSKLVF